MNSATDGPQFDTNSTEIMPNPQRDMYIYGAPGDEDYDVPRTADDVMRLEAMWEIDHQVQSYRGGMQGFRRGFYRDGMYRVPETCLDKTTTLQMYYLGKYWSHFQMKELTVVLGLVWNIWYNVDYECPIEELLYDLSCYCFDHDCSFQALI